MDKITALLDFLPQDWKAATVIILIVYYFSFRLLKKDIKNIEKVLDRDRTSLKGLLDRDRASINEKIGHIDKQLSNHVTETNDKIKELKADVKGLKSGQDKLAVGKPPLKSRMLKGMPNFTSF